MPANFPERLELRQRAYLWSKTQLRVTIGSGVLMLIGLAVLVVFFATMALRKYGDVELLLDAFLRAVTRNPVDNLSKISILVLVTVHLIYARRASRLERLILSANGIEYRSPLPAALQFLRPSWSRQWSQIRAAVLQNMPLVQGPQGIVLMLDSGMRTVRVYPWRWVDPQDYLPISPLREMRWLRRLTAAEAAAQIDESPVMQYVTAALPHLAIKRGAVVAGQFALEKNKRSLGIVVLFFPLVIYAFADGVMLGEETYANEVPMQLFVIAGTGAAVAAALWMLGGKVPLAESLIISVLFGGALGAATYPGALRLNALTDTEGLRTYEYVLRPNLTLSPAESGPPELSFPQYADYWQQFKPGSKHEFELRHGGLGFFQLNFEPVRLAMREYYRKRQCSR
jgi:hypothetical protein